MELNETRHEIDSVDDQILQLFLKRMDLTEEIAAYKNEHHLPISNQQRELEILSRVTAEAGSLSPYARRLFTALFTLSRSRQTELLNSSTNLSSVDLRDETPFPQAGQIACQGPEGSGSRVACNKLFTNGNAVNTKNLRDVCEAVESGQCDFGILPVENGFSGPLLSVYDLLREKHLFIVRSILLNIRYELLALPGVKLENITEIYTSEQAVSQCMGLLNGSTNRHILSTDSTAAAAKLVGGSDSRNAAAVAPSICGRLYGLAPVPGKTRNHFDARIRFICTAKKPVIYAGANQIGLIMTCDNQPGALYEILSKPAALGINMSRLRFLSDIAQSSEFVFFLELEASIQDPGISTMLGEIRQNCREFQFLGGYTEI